MSVFPSNRNRHPTPGSQLPPWHDWNGSPKSVFLPEPPSFPRPTLEAFDVIQNNSLLFIQKLYIKKELRFDNSADPRGSFSRSIKEPCVNSTATSTPGHRTEGHSLKTIHAVLIGSQEDSPFIRLNNSQGFLDYLFKLSLLWPSLEYF